MEKLLRYSWIDQLGQTDGLASGSRGFFDNNIFVFVERTALLLVFLLVFSFDLSAQNDSTRLDFLHDIPLSTPFFTTDRLTNVYTVSPSNEVIKYNREGQEQFRFNNNTLGTLTYIDATDPFNLLLFYPDYRTVFLLDRTLTQTEEFNLFDLDVMDVPAVGISNDNNLWIYDDVKFVIKKINRNGEVLLESNNLNLLLGAVITPNFILERNNTVFVNDPEKGILLFDLFGNYIKTIDIKQLRQFQVIKDQLVYQQDGQLMVFNLKSLTGRSLNLNMDGTEDALIRIEKDRVYVGMESGLKVFKLGMRK